MKDTKIKKEFYIETMHNYEELNADIMKLINSKEYRLGLFLINIIKNCNYKSLKNFISNKIALKRIKKKNFPYDNFIDFTSYPKENYFSEEQIAVYTCVYGNYDILQEPSILVDNIDYYVFTDIEMPEDSVWNKININLPPGLSAVEKSRYVKMHPHEFFSNYNFSIYVDGSMKIVSDLTPLIYHIGSSGIAIHMHSKRIDVYDELEVGLITKRINKSEAKRYEKYLHDIGMPKNYGLLECGMIVREHNNECCKQIMEKWWIQFKDYIKRDQISLPVILYLEGIEIKEVGTLGNNIYKNHKICIYRHK